MEKQLWPSWRYGPNGEAGVFESEDDVPEGWLGHPSEHVKPEPDPVETGELDADGWPWDAALHVDPPNKTQAGLWQMKAFITRPPPKPPLDL